MITRTVDQTRAAVAAARTAGKTIGFVPTMGYLHEGHVSLIDRAREAGATFVVVSIFVNPAQFGPNEDFDKYPRDEARDLELLESRGADLVFMPPVEVIYPAGFDTGVVPGTIAGPLEGERRPGHFEGVATVVLKLFNIVQPDLAVFGQKDAQQCAIVSKMVHDLDVPVKLVFAPTIREVDGLAMSSRNSYLSADERARSVALSRALRAGEESIRAGVRDTEAVEQAMQRELRRHDGVVLDYLRLVDPLTFLHPSDFDRDLLLVGAVRVGRTRLIDNIRISRAAIPAAALQGVRE